jgi:assimilatory nitrate reductase catalytic subunit
LINGWIHVVIEHNLVDREYVEAHTTGFDALREAVKSYNAGARGRDHGPLAGDRSSRPRGCTPHARAGFIGWTMGVNHSTKGTETVNGHQQPGAHHREHREGRRGARFRSPASATRLGTREAGFASIMPGYRKFESDKDRADLRACGTCPVERIPSQARARVSPTSSKRRSKEDPGALDHRHQPDRLVPQPGPR